MEQTKELNNCDTNNNLSQTLPITNKNQLKQRDAGFEILRIIAMVLIICHHLLDYGGFISNAQSSLELALLRLLHSFFTVSVNVFILISAYFTVTSKFKWKRLAMLWGDVVFYSVLFYLSNLIATKTSFEITTFAKLFLPVTTNSYWFFTDYFILSLIAPFLNKMLKNCTKQEYYFLLILIGIFSYSSLRLGLDKIVSTGYGYNLIWFICLYIVGAFFKLYPIKEKKWLTTLIYFSSILLIFSNLYLPTDFPLYQYLHMPAEYTCPLVLIASVSIFLLFKDVKFQNVKINNTIRFISKSAFIVYLFDGSHLRDWLYFDLLKIQNYYSQDYSILMILLFALAIFSIAVIIDIIKRGIVKLIEIITIKIKDKRSKEISD